MKDLDSAVFERGTLRAVVCYERTDWMNGETFGRVTTVYPNEGQPSTIGEIIYRSSESTNR